VNKSGPCIVIATRAVRSAHSRAGTRNNGRQPAGRVRIPELERDIEQLAYVEEALVAAAIAEGEDAQRSPSAPPQAVLQVRVVEATKSSRAA
jgi:hypothetical protein